MGRILRDYGEESNWRTLQKKIVLARLEGGLHSTTDLLDLIQRVTPGMKGLLSFSSFLLQLYFFSRTISIISHAYAINDRTTIFKFIIWYHMVKFSPLHRNYPFIFKCYSRSHKCLLHFLLMKIPTWYYCPQFSKTITIP